MNYQYDGSNVQTGQSSFMTQVYGWMTLALLITGMTAMITASSYSILSFIFSSNIVFYGLIIGEFALVIFLSRRISKMSTSTAIGAFILYSVLNGLTISAIFFLYTTSSIASTFLIAASTFAVMSIYGYTTKKDLSSTGKFLFMGLIGFIIASIVNIFMQSEMIYWITTYVGVFIFIGLTAYDTQKLKALYSAGALTGENMVKLSIRGALRLYLDFINLFLLLLRLLGRRK